MWPHNHCVHQPVKLTATTPLCHETEMASDGLPDNLLLGAP